MHIFLFRFLTASPILAQSLLFFGMVIEGDLFLFTAGFLVHLHILDPGDTLISIFLGTILGDLLWYRLGKTDTTRNKFLGWLGRTADMAGQRLDRHVMDRTFRTLFFSKFVYGAHHFTLVRAGRLGVPLRRFIRADVIASFLWIFIVGGLGYLASASFDHLRHRLHYIELALLAAILGYIVIDRLIGRFLKKRL